MSQYHPLVVDHAYIEAVLNQYGLTKWCHVQISGQQYDGSKVTVDQAKSIVYRYDKWNVDVCEHLWAGSLFGNSSSMDKLFRALVRAPQLVKAVGASHDEDDVFSTGYSDLLLQISQRVNSIVFPDPIVYSKYFSTHWGSSCYIGGPHGWINPSDATIQFGHNWGKYPAIENVVVDAIQLIQLFPFLDLVISIWSDEDNQAEPYFTFRINQDGWVILPNEESQHFTPFVKLDPLASFISAMKSAQYKEFTIPDEQILHMCEVDPLGMSQLFGEFATREHGLPPSYYAEIALKYRACFDKVLNFIYNHGTAKLESQLLLIEM